MMYWPSAPLLKSPALKGMATANPVRISGVVATRLSCQPRVSRKALSMIPQYPLPTFSRPITGFSAVIMMTMAPITRAEKMASRGMVKAERRRSRQERLPALSFVEDSAIISLVALCF